MGARGVLLIGLSCVVAFAAGILWRPLDSPATAPSSESRLRPGFEETVDAYDSASRQVLGEHVTAALAGVQPGDKLSEALAMNAYVFAHFDRARGATGENGVEILQSGEAICGGMVAALNEMLYYAGIRSRAAYAVGGKAAHSMVEADLGDGRRLLLDPYHGLAYVDERRPLSLVEARAAAQAGRSRVVRVFERRRGDAPIDWYVRYGWQSRNLRDFSLDVLAEAHGAGVAFEGYVHRVVLDLAPGDVLGAAHWNGEGAPWTELALLRDERGAYRSWAHQLGDDPAMGYRVRHTYRLSGLTPARSYVLTIYAASVYADETTGARLLTLSHEDGREFYYPVEPADFSPARYRPEVIRHRFVASAATEMVLAELTGVATLQAITLD